MTAVNKTNLAKYKKRLQQMEQEVHQLSLSTKEDRAPVTLDQSMVGRLSRMDALQTQAMQLELERRRDTEIKRIHAALKRIDDGTFGECVHCGEDIHSERLEYDPAVPICINCAKPQD